MKHQYRALTVKVMPSNSALGAGAASDFAVAISSALETRDEVCVILATGNSQLSFASALRGRADIEWSRITVLHMDEYLGMPASHPASFRRWIEDNIVGPLKPKAFHGIRADQTPVGDEILRYTEIVRSLDPVVCVMGIGENGHLAFNDPPADFETHELMHVVELDEACRMQQVREGHFSSLDETPRRALSLTVHALLRPTHILVLVPEARKAGAVKAALEGPVTPLCPASILQTASNAQLYLDQDSASLLTPEGTKT